MSLEQKRTLHRLCRVYRAMLRLYPPDFQREYGREMMVTFQTRAASVLRERGHSALLPFAAHITWDWLRTTSRENSMTARMSFIRWIAALPAAILASYLSMRLVGLALAFAVAKQHFAPSPARGASS